MTSDFDNLFDQLLTALQIAEKRHRAVRDSASDNSDWSTYDSEGELISRIIKWRRSLEPLLAEIMASGAIADVDIPISPVFIMKNPPLSAADINSIPAQADMPLRSDDERVGRYVWQKNEGFK